MLPLSKKWIEDRLDPYVKDLKSKGKKYKTVKDDIKELTKFKFGFLKFEIPDKNILVVKNYNHNKGYDIIIKPYFTSEKLHYRKRYNNVNEVIKKEMVNIDYNVFEDLKQKGKYSDGD